MPMKVKVAGQSFNVEPKGNRGFWFHVGRGVWEPETYAIFRRHITADTLHLDIGAWIGSTALYAAQLARKCVAFEPDPVAFQQLSRNLAANAGARWVDRIEIHDCAINADGRSFVLGGSEAGADSMSSALFPDRDSQWTVRARRLSDVLAAHRAPGQPVFIKMDIEGGEYDLIASIAAVLADPLITAYISFHPKMLGLALAATHPGDAWHAPFIARHVAVLDTLPWTANWISPKSC
jgi:FkbM family methyltransferase